MTDNEFIEKLGQLWQRHADEQAKRGQEVDAESFVDYLRIQGWLAGEDEG